MILGKGILLPTPKLLKTASSLWFGYDEVWFFPEPIKEEKPDALTIVGPARVDRTRLMDLRAGCPGTTACWLWVMVQD